MNVLLEVSTIAIGTAVLAALIVAAGWDLGVIRAWQSLTAPEARREEAPSREEAPIWRTTSWEEPARTSSSRGGYSESPGFAPVPAPLTVVRAPDRNPAEEWLAAAAAHRLADFDLDEDMTRAIPLREALAARHRAA
jgi:hypothetical protein